MQTLYFDLRDTKGPQKEMEDKISAAAKILREGGLVALPTETVYGLGANGLMGSAVNRVFEVKGRPNDNPLILHLTGPQWLPRYCEDVPPLAYVLARKFWPGPLTMILKRKSMIPNETTAGLSTVAVRCPNHPVTLSVIREAGVPIAAPSANLSGRPSCTSAQDVMADMDGKVDAVVDGGPCTVGVESTILDLTCNPPRLLRPGGLPLEDLQRLIGKIDVDKAVAAPLAEGEQPKAPGMKYRHYAPKAPLTVVTGAPKDSAQEIQRRMGPTSGIICFDEFASLFAGQEVRRLGPADDKLVQAQRLFELLRSFDETAVTEIYAQCPDNRGLGLAIGNRLKKAAGFQIIEANGQRVVLGLTGGTGGGKTSALRAIQSLGGMVIDCDAVYHEMLSSNQQLREEIHAAFPGVFREDGTLDRKRLGQEVFQDKHQLEKLDQIIFRHMGPEVRRLLDESDTRLCAIDAINLLESGIADLCDRTVAVTSPVELRVRRIMARDGITEQYARMRIAAQKPDEYYRGRCHFELSNAADTPAAFEDQAREFFERLVEQIKEEKQRERAEA